MKQQWCLFNNIKLYIKRTNIKQSEYEVITKNMRLDFYKEIIANLPSIFFNINFLSLSSNAFIWIIYFIFII